MIAVPHSRHETPSVATTEGDFPHTKRRSIVLCQAGTTCCCCCFTFLLGAFGAGIGSGSGLIPSTPAIDDEALDASFRESAERFATWLFGLALAGLVGGGLIGYTLDLGFGVRLFRGPSLMWSAVMGVVAGSVRAVWLDRSHGWLVVRFLIWVTACTSVGTVMGCAAGGAYDHLYDEGFYWILGGAAGAGLGLSVGIKLAWPRVVLADTRRAALERAVERFLATIVIIAVVGFVVGWLSGYVIDRIWHVQMFGQWAARAGICGGIAAGFCLAVRADRSADWRAVRFLVQLITHGSCGVIMGSASGFGIDSLFDLLWW